MKKVFLVLILFVVTGCVSLCLFERNYRESKRRLALEVFKFPDGCKVVKNTFENGRHEIHVSGQDELLISWAYYSYLMRDRFKDVLTKPTSFSNEGLFIGRRTTYLVFRDEVQLSAFPDCYAHLEVFFHRESESTVRCEASLVVLDNAGSVP